jgi:hypothetical protein
MLIRGEDVHIVVRSSGERTVEVCTRLASISEQGNSGITVVEEVPFEVALRSSYEAGILAGKKWTMTLDGDVLLHPHAITALIEAAEKMPSHFVELEGIIYDKLLGRYRQAGHRIYRTELLPLALEQIPAEGDEIQPEYFTVRKMCRLGHPSRFVHEIVGLHDFEQYYADLYRKALIHAKKHAPSLSELIMRAAQLMHDDSDFKVLLKGIWDGLVEREKVTLNASRYKERGILALESLGVVEKSPIMNIESFVNTFPQLYASVRSAYSAPTIETMDMTRDDGGTQYAYKYKRLRRRFSERGLLRGSLGTLGSLLRMLGQRLENS